MRLLPLRLLATFIAFVSLVMPFMSVVLTLYVVATPVCCSAQEVQPAQQSKRQSAQQQSARSAQQEHNTTHTAKQAIVTDKAPKPIQGVYSQAVQTNGMVFLAGQIALTPDGKLIEGDTVAQLKQIFANIEAVLHAAGCTLDDIVKTTVFLKDMNDFAAMNEAYAAVFKPLKSGIAPARTTVEVARLPRDARIEIEAIAVQPRR